MTGGNIPPLRLESNDNNVHTARRRVKNSKAVTMMKTRVPSSSALAAAALALLVAAASAQAPGTFAASGTQAIIASALGELPENIRSDVTDLMASMNMTPDTTHFQRFMSREDGALMKESMALIR